MSELLNVGNAVAKSGEITKGYIKGIELNNGLSLDVPVLVAKGKQNGPTLLLSSTEHGTEIQGVWIIQQIINEKLDLETLRGTVIGIPVMNPMAFFVGRYRSWVEQGGCMGKYALQRSTRRSLVLDNRHNRP
jgi:predicted deacylase